MLIVYFNKIGFTIGYKLLERCSLVFPGWDNQVLTFLIHRPPSTALLWCFTALSWWLSVEEKVFPDMYEYRYSPLSMAWNVLFNWSWQLCNRIDCLKFLIFFLVFLEWMFLIKLCVIMQLCILVPVLICTNFHFAGVFYYAYCIGWQSVKCCVEVMKDASKYFPQSGNNWATGTRFDHLFKQV